MEQEPPQPDPPKPEEPLGEPPFDASDLLRLAAMIAALAVALVAILLRGTALPSCWEQALSMLFLVSGGAALAGALFAFVEVWSETFRWSRRADLARNPTNYRATLICVGASLVVLGPTFVTLATATIFYL